MLADIKNGFWQLRRSPGFAFTAILTLALGIGATTAIFTLVQQVLLRSLPVSDPAGLWRVGDNEQCCNNSGLPDYTDKPNDWSLFSYPQYTQFRDHTNGMASLAAFESDDQEMAVRRAGTGDPAKPFYTEFVSGNSFETLGLRAYAGRLFQPSDDVAGAAPVAVMSFEMWEEQLGRDPSAVGSSYLINGQPVAVVGIAPPGFYSERLSPTPPAFWLPLHLVSTVTPRNADMLERGDQQWLNLIGRLAPGANGATVQAQMQVELQQFLKSPLSKITGREQALIPLQYLRLSPGGGGVQRMQDQYQDDLRLLMWISSFVLLIACANLANLMLARSVTQRQQIAVRAALGAQRKRLVQRALVECVVLAMVGGLAGVLVAWSGAKLILHLAFQQNPVSIAASPSPVVLGFAFGVSLSTGLLFGVAPAWMAAQADPIQALRGANRSTGRHSTLAQQGLVVAQAAISVVLLCAAGYLILSLQKLEHQHFGFETTHRTIVKFNAPTAGLQPEQLDGVYRRLDTALSSLPEIERVSWSLWSPMDGGNYSEDVYIAGQTPPPAGSSVNLASWVRVSPRYFATVGTKLLQGREFTESDDRTAPNVAIVDEAFVKRYLHAENPIGAHFGESDPAGTGMFTIVGVVEDAQYWPPNDLQEASHPMYFLPAAQWPQVAATTPNAAVYARFATNTHYMKSLEIETRGAAPDLEAQVSQALAAINPNLMITRYQSFADQVNLGFSQQSMIVQLTSLFGLVALALAAIGLYGVTAYAVAQRKTEIAIRMALGANRVHVQGMVLRSAFLQVGLGLLIGIPAAIAAGHLMASELFGVNAWNPLVLGMTTLVLVGVALLAAAAPAHRAAGVEPIEALRGE
jgi:predicted permease